MKAALIACIVAFASPAGAAAWMDQGCSFGIVSEAGEFQYLGENDAVACKLTAAQELTCADGKKRQMVTLPENELMLDNVRLYVVGPENPAICD